jgi:hypothetical protein
MLHVESMEESFPFLDIPPQSRQLEVAIHLKQDGRETVDGIHITMGVAKQGVGDLGQEISERPTIGSPNLLASPILRRKLVDGLLARDQSTGPSGILHVDLNLRNHISSLLAPFRRVLLDDGLEKIRVGPLHKHEIIMGG